MKILMGHFHSESNEHSRQQLDFDRFIFKFGDEMVDAMHVKDIFEKEGIACLPSIYAHGHPGGPITRDTFDFILERYEIALKKHLHEIDGIYLYLHGASKVIDLECTSAEHAILQRTRDIVGPYMPIAVVMDPHGNLSQSFVDNANIIRCFRESPHTDAVETHRIVAKMLVDLLQNRRPVQAVYRKIPIMIGGERSVSSDEPVRSFNRMLDKIESDPRIMSASYHVGYLRHDSDKLGNAVVVVPNDNQHLDYANQKADEMAAYIWSKRDEFSFHNNYGEPEEALRSVVEFEGGPCFLTDSGDNCGAGADGYNTYILRQIMDLNDYCNKEYLIAGIVDQKNFPYLYRSEVGDYVEFNCGMDYDELSKSVYLSGEIIAKGLVSERYAKKPELGTAISIKLDDKPITVVILNESISYYSLDQFESSNLNIDDYDVFVIKQGYLAPDFIEIAEYYTMSLTEGPTYQRSEKLNFKRIMRPMWPYDKDFDYKP